MIIIKSTKFEKASNACFFRIKKMKEIIDASANKDIAGIASMLFLEYATELNVDLCFQNFSQELEDPLFKYGPPSGALFIAFYNNEPAGCIALQPISLAKTCEMKRLYVKPECRNMGIATTLVETLTNRAKELGYTRMVLDTLDKLVPAIALYKHHGFIETTSYYNNPLPGVVYMAKEL